ncbi:MAG: hypothetical protein JWL71_909 [Acidobacteria bacterium]|nr:hypothetical protein [Acidobacteriota bacterium]
MNTFDSRLSRWAVAMAALLCFAAPAAAQYKPRTLNDPATGENYHIEAGADLWFPTADMVVSSEQLGIAGSQIDFKKTLGLTDQHFPALQIQLRPARSHKFRLNYIPATYTQTTTLNQDIVFNGIRYRLGLPVNSTLDWKTYELTYEYDFVVKNWGFVGFDLMAKYTDVQVALASPLASEFAHARGPIPAIGGIARYYVVPNISITGEFSGFKIPDSIDSRYNAHYVDVDVYGTLNFTNNIGVKGGYRSRDVGYLIKSDSGQFTMKGIYVGAVLRY